MEPDKTSEDGVTEYVDVIGSENNRVMDYKVVAYDKYLNTTATKVFDSIKIRHDGELPSDDWTVSTNTVSDYGTQKHLILYMKHHHYYYILMRMPNL